MQPISYNKHVNAKKCSHEPSVMAALRERCDVCGFYGTNSLVSIAPPRLGSVAVTFTTLCESLATQIVCLSASFSVSITSTLKASKLPAGTVTVSDPTTFNCLVCGFCFCTSKFKNEVM